MMIEVFKTNVNDPHQASGLIRQLHKTFIGYEANFDLEDCDNILRVQSATGVIQTAVLINFLTDFGCSAQVLPDDDPPAGPSQQLNVKQYPPNDPTIK